MTDVNFQITVLKGRIRQGHIANASCYIVGFIRGVQVFRTDIAADSLTPKWNQAFQLSMSNTDLLSLYLYEASDAFHHNILGKTILYFADINHYLKKKLSFMRRVKLSINDTGDRLMKHPKFKIHVFIGKIVIGSQINGEPISRQRVGGGFPIDAYMEAGLVSNNDAQFISAALGSVITPAIDRESTTQTSPNQSTTTEGTTTTISTVQSSMDSILSTSLSHNSERNRRISEEIANTCLSMSTPQESADSWTVQRNALRRNFEDRFLFNSSSPTTSVEERVDDESLPLVIESLLGPMPDSVEVRIDPSNGKRYFINHSDKTSTWIDPRMFWIDPKHYPLSKQWKVTISTVGLPYFVDTLRKITSYNDPRTSLPIIPPGCVAMKFKTIFREKMIYFRALCKEYLREGIIKIPVSRNKIIDDSYSIIMSISPVKLHRHLAVKFDNEIGLDYGGLAREWLFEVSHDIINPMYGLFITRGSSSDYVFDINPLSVILPNYLKYYLFIGRLIGLALFHAKFLDCSFSNIFYKHILNRPLVLDDIQQVDVDFYNSVKWIGKNNIEEAELELYFCAETESFGQLELVQLKPGGTDIRVTEKNKFEYIRLLIDWKLNYGRREQMNQVMIGISNIVPLTWLRCFSAKELEMMLCGLQHYDLHDWRSNTRFRGGFNNRSIQVLWFWQFVESLDPEYRGKLLHFITGTTRVPPTGFKDLIGSNGFQKFCIEKWGTPADLPRAHTCFNRLDLPPYNSYEELKSKLFVAIEEGQGFYQE